MPELTSLIGFLKGASVEMTAILVTATVLVTLWLNSRKVDVEGMTSLSKAQIENLNALMKQNKDLTDDLHHLREEQAKLHKAMDQLRRQNTRMYQHILALEALVQHYRPRCADCPHSPGEPPYMPPMPFKLEEIDL